MFFDYRTFQIIKKGYLQRIRSYRFIVILSIVVMFVYLFIPAPDATYRTFSIGNFKGIYNDVFIDVMTAIGTSLLVSLFAFFIINNSLELDDQNHVSEIIASTPTRNHTYLLGQALSNFAVLLTILCTIIFTTLVVFVFRQQKYGINVIDFLLPFILICVPVMFLIAVLGVVFETFLQSKYITMGIIYYLLYLSFLITLMNYITVPNQNYNNLYSFVDPFGIIYVIRVIQNVILAQFPSANVYNIEIGFTYSVTGSNLYPSSYLFTSISWSVSYILSRIFWFLLAIMVLFFDSLFFKRFDLNYRRFRGNDNANNTQITKHDENELNFESKEKNDKILPSLAKSNRNIPFLTYFSPEVKIQLKKRSIWWYMLVIFFFIIGFTITESSLQIWSVAWLCIVPIISPLGSQEKIYGTQEIVFSCPKPIKRYMYQMVDFFLIIFVLNLGIILGFLIHGEYEHIIAILVGMLFAISLASFFGLVSGSKKISECFFLLLFYLGPFNGIPYFDFIGVVSTSLTLHIWIFYLLLSIILLAISFLKVKKIGIEN